MRASARVLGVSLAATVLAGCTVTVGNQSGDETPHEATKPTHGWVRDNKATLDFTRRPTREAFGFPHDAQFSAADRHGPPIDVTIKLPDGTIHVPAFNLSAATNSAGGADDTVYTHIPKHINVLARYPAKEAFDVLREQAPALGISRERLTEFQPDFGAGALVPQEGVLEGLIKDWLDIEVLVSDSVLPGQVQINYQISVDRYHNEAVDKILHDDKLHFDLTRRPTRDELGFLPTYNMAGIYAEPFRLFEVTIDTARGPLGILTDNVDSGSGNTQVLDDDPQGVKPPGSLDLGGGVRMTTQETHDELLHNARTLGIDPATINRLFSPRSPKVRDKIIATVHTDVFDLSVKLTTTDSFGQLEADVAYLFTFRRI